MEDEDALMNVIVKPDVYGRYYKVLRNCFLLILEGTIQKQGGILNVLAEGAMRIHSPLAWRKSQLTRGSGSCRPSPTSPQHQQASLRCRTRKMWTLSPSMS